jgi:hypothetical protein
LTHRLRNCAGIAPLALGTPLPKVAGKFGIIQYRITEL